MAKQSGLSHFLAKLDIPMPQLSKKAKERLVSFSVKAGVIMGIGAAALLGATQIHETINAETSGPAIQTLDSKPYVTEPSIKAVEAETVQDMRDGFLGASAGVGLLSFACLAGAAFAVRRISRNDPTDSSVAIFNQPQPWTVKDWAAEVTHLIDAQASEQSISFALNPLEDTLADLEPLAA